ncbi:uncharacterized protein ACHE_40982S [Aspergillus chevalieri]|uniref:SPT2 chromatin protein n=1 Tax=Aspergillus chevalieri TaxID=182096 RepID=A0A7R7VQT8_ASPCH|nr:uncharacterized protein ACHE_40982S [Aspergillus chevalieri]BCR88418.1 hypothetical protein ACHE_40982S [Aspergillus chevalieri]
MSFLDSVLTSIETGKPSAIPPATSRRPEPPVSSSTAKSEVRKPSTPSRDVSSEKKVAAAGTKRKAEEQLQRPSKPDNRAPGKSVPTRPAPTRPATTSTASKPRPNPAPNAAKSASSSNTSSAPKAAPVSSKPPPPGSYADLMMKAKALQQNAPTQVGMFKHQNKTAPKERLSKMERKKRAMEAQAKEKDPRLAKKGGATAGTLAGAKPGDGKPARKRDPDEPTYKGTARPTQTPATTEYRGTAGLPAKRDPAERRQSRAGKRSRMDEYLGTDEEDEGEYADDYDDYYSDASSDMEAGFDNVESEEQAALKAARREDEEEWQAELAAKKEKMERKKKLASLASRAR